MKVPLATGLLLLITQAAAQCQLSPALNMNCNNGCSCEALQGGSNYCARSHDFGAAQYGGDTCDDAPISCGNSHIPCGHSAWTPTTGAPVFTAANDCCDPRAHECLEATHSGGDGVSKFSSCSLRDEPTKRCPGEGNGPPSSVDASINTVVQAESYCNYRGNFWKGGPLETDSQDPGRQWLGYLNPDHKFHYHVPGSDFPLNSPITVEYQVAMGDGRNAGQINAYFVEGKDCSVDKKFGRINTRGPTGGGLYVFFDISGEVFELSRQPVDDMLTLCIQSGGWVNVDSFTFRSEAPHCANSGISCDPNEDREVNPESTWCPSGGCNEGFCCKDTPPVQVVPVEPVESPTAAPMPGPAVPTPTAAPTPAPTAPPTPAPTPAPTPRPVPTGSFNVLVATELPGENFQTFAGPREEAFLAAVSEVSGGYDVATEEIKDIGMPGRRRSRRLQISGVEVTSDVSGMETQEEADEVLDTIITATNDGSLLAAFNKYLEEAGLSLSPSEELISRDASARDPNQIVDSPRSDNQGLDDAQTSGTKKQGPGIGAICGIVAAVIFFILVVVLIYMWRRRKAKTGQDDKNNTSKGKSKGKGVMKGDNSLGQSARARSAAPDSPADTEAPMEPPGDIFAIDSPSNDDSVATPDGDRPVSMKRVGTFHGNWEKYEDPEGDIFYWNTATGASSWDPPPREQV